MKKITYIMMIFTTLFLTNCSEDDLSLFPEHLDPLEEIDSEEKLQKILNMAYLEISDANALGAEATFFGDIMGDKIFVSATSNAYLETTNFTFSMLNNSFAFYGKMYSSIAYCNVVINNQIVEGSENVNRLKSEAKILRAYAYLHLVNSYSPSTKSGVNQEYGVPLVLEQFDITIQPARATVSQVFDQIIKDLEDGIEGAADVPARKNVLTKTSARLILSRVYLTRLAEGDAQLALQYANEVINNSPSQYAPISVGNYVDYFSSADDDVAENRSETIWELDLSGTNNLITGISSNLSLPSYYHRTGARRGFLLRQSFVDSFGPNDIRRGLFTTTGAPVEDPQGVWTNKYPRNSNAPSPGGNFIRDIKVLRFSEAQLNRIEALYLTGQTNLALTELNAFAESRNGSTYSGANLLNDILEERAKEFYAEGQRFYDLKRHNLPIVRTSNCVTCELPAGDKHFIFPLDEDAINFNENSTQYPGY